MIGSRRRILYTLLVFGLSACSRQDQGVQAHLDDHYPERLSEWRIFAGDLKDLKPSSGVIPYEVAMPLYSNAAAKFRTIWMPPGESGTYTENGAFPLPVGTILTKTFSYGSRRIETRLYVHKRNGWQGITYVWKRDQSDADLDVTPAPIAVNWHGRVFDYEIPNVNQCKSCHEGPADNGPLGISARQLNRDYKYSTNVENQLVHWSKAGYLKNVPPKPPAYGSDLESQARAYLDANCASCHVVGGRGMKSGIFLNYEEKAPKGLVAGDPEASSILRSMLTADPKKMMPPIGRSLVDDDGAALIRRWIVSKH